MSQLLHGTCIHPKSMFIHLQVGYNWAFSILSGNRSPGGIKRLPTTPSSRPHASQGCWWRGQNPVWGGGNSSRCRRGSGPARASGKGARRRDKEARLRSEAASAETALVHLQRPPATGTPFPSRGCSPEASLLGVGGREGRADQAALHPAGRGRPPAQGSGACAA